MVHDVVDDNLELELLLGHKAMLQCDGLEGMEMPMELLEKLHDEIPLVDEIQLVEMELE